MGLSTYHYAIPNKRLQGVDRIFYHKSILGNVAKECQWSAREGIAVLYQTLVDAYDIDDHMLGGKMNMIKRDSGPEHR